MTRQQCGQVVLLLLGILFAIAMMWVTLAEARAGGGASSGSRGSAGMGSYSRAPSYRGGSTPSASVPRSSSDAMRSSTAQQLPPSRPSPWHVPVYTAPAPVYVTPAPSGGSDWLFWWMMMNNQNRAHPTAPAAAPAPVQVPLRDPDMPAPPQPAPFADTLVTIILVVIVVLVCLSPVLLGIWLWRRIR